MNIKFLCVLVFVISLIPVFVSAEALFLFKRSHPNQVDEYYRLVERSDQEINELVSLLNRSFSIKQDISFIAGNNDGPVFDSENNEILMPDDFTIGVYETFRQANYVKTEEELVAVTMDVILHTLFHEVGHALVYQLELPITGKEEDAVDNLATILILTTYDGGHEIALSAADLFGIVDSEINEFSEVDFWGEHSLDAQRFYNGICLIYGSDPEQYQGLIDELEISEDRAQLCIEDYGREERAWMTLLEPYFKDDKN